MSHYVGYNIRSHVSTAPQMMALRRIISGHSIGEGGGPRRTVNVLKREGVVTEPQLGMFQATEFGRQVADIADHRDMIPPQAESSNRIVTDHLNEFWDYLYSHPKTYHY